MNKLKIVQATKIFCMLLISDVHRKSMWIGLRPVERNWCGQDFCCYASIDSIIRYTFLLWPFCKAKLSACMQPFDSNQDPNRVNCVSYNTDLPCVLEAICCLLLFWFLLDFYWISMFHIKYVIDSMVWTIKMLTVLLSSRKYSSAIHIRIRNANKLTSTVTNKFCDSAVENNRKRWASTIMRRILSEFCHNLKSCQHTYPSIDTNNNNNNNGISFA